MKLEILPFEADDLIRVRCEGPLSLAGLPLGADPFRQILGPQAFSRKVLLDLKRAEGADTSGVAWLMRMTDQFARSGGRLILNSIPPMVEQIIHVLGLGSHFAASQPAEDAGRLSLREVVVNDREPPVVAGRVGAVNHSPGSL